MYGGQLVEIATTADLFGDPQHPYTQALLNAMPARHQKGERLASIEGSVSGSQRLTGCPFAPRCPRADQTCVDIRPEQRVIGGSTVRCHHPGEGA